MRSSPQGKSSPHGRITSVNRFASVRLSATAPQGNASLRGRITSRNGLGTCGISSQHRGPACSATARTAETTGATGARQRAPEATGAAPGTPCTWASASTSRASTREKNTQKLVTLKAILGSCKLGNSLSLRGCTPIYQRLPYCVGMFCRFFKIKEAKQIKEETRNFGKIAKARAKNLRAFAIFSKFRVSCLICFAS